MKTHSRVKEEQVVEKVVFFNNLEGIILLQSWIPMKNFCGILLTKKSIVITINVIEIVVIKGCAMRISKRTRYGVRLMIELALSYREKPLSVSQIAENEEISPKFLGQIIIPLKGAGLIQSRRGAQGGYKLTRPPEKITLLEVFRVLEGDCLLTECISDPGTCTRSAVCVAKEIWDDLTRTIEQRLKSIDFEELAKRSRNLEERSSPVFQI